MLYRQLEEHDRMGKVASRLREKGVDEKIIRECLGGWDKIYAEQEL